MTSEATRTAVFSIIRYAQCWEDADILLTGLDIQPGDSCLSIASAGDNALAMLTCDPGRVIALDLNPAQLACLELRVAAFRTLEHGELLEMIGSRPSRRRDALYQRCRPEMSEQTRRFWDAKNREILDGIGAAGKFEHYFRLFRRFGLPLIHNRKTISALMQKRNRADRIDFYERIWNNRRWWILFQIFFSRFMMGKLGRDPSFFRYVEGSVADRILQRTRHALTELDPSENPYLQWILTGEHPFALPLALREENFEVIRSRLERLEWHCQSVEEFLPSLGVDKIHRFNLSDIFEYMSEENYQKLLLRLTDKAHEGGRMVYWNMLAPRSRPESMAGRLQPLHTLADRLHQIDKAFFYNALIIEEVSA
jgi:S-adenosylmethionine-diacylglycerol 3-amino-3-carboxypropyl transferase